METEYIEQVLNEVPEEGIQEVILILQQKFNAEFEKFMPGMDRAKYSKIVVKQIEKAVLALSSDEHLRMTNENLIDCSNIAPVMVDSKLKSFFKRIQLFNPGKN